MNDPSYTKTALQTQSLVTIHSQVSKMVCIVATLTIVSKVKVFVYKCDIPNKKASQPAKTHLYLQTSTSLSPFSTALTSGGKAISNNSIEPAGG